MWQGKIAEAVALYRQALALKPDYVEAYTNLAMALVTAEEFVVALAALRCAFGLKETNEARSPCRPLPQTLALDAGRRRSPRFRLARTIGGLGPAGGARAGERRHHQKEPRRRRKHRACNECLAEAAAGGRAVGGFRPRGCLRGSTASMPARIHSDLGHRDGAVSDRRPLRAAPARRGGRRVDCYRGARARLLLRPGAPVLRQRICLCLRR